MHFLTAPEVLRSRCRQIWSLEGLFPGLADGGLLLSLRSVDPQYVCLLVPFYRDTSPIRPALYPNNLIYCNYLFKDPISKHSHIPEMLGIKTSTYSFGENTVQPIMTVFVHFYEHSRRSGN